MLPLDSTAHPPFERNITSRYAFLSLLIPANIKRVNNAVIRRGSGGASSALAPGVTPTGPAGPSGYGGTPAKRGAGNGGGGMVQSNNDIDGA